MKKNTRYLLGCLFAFTIITVLFSACIKDTVKRTKTYTIYTPVYKEKAAVLNSINGNAAESIQQAGKIYVKDNFIYLN